MKKSGKMLIVDRIMSIFLWSKICRASLAQPLKKIFSRAPKRKWTNFINSRTIICKSRKWISFCKICTTFSYLEFFWPVFLAFELNTEICSVNLHIQSVCGKIRTRKTLKTDTFHAVTEQKTQNNDKFAGIFV